MQGKGFEPQFTGMIFIDRQRFTPVGIKRAILYVVSCFEIVGNSMRYRYRRHITNTLLYAIIITAIMGIISQYSREGTIIFAIVSVVALAADRLVENKHLKELEDKGVSPKP